MRLNAFLIVAERITRSGETHKKEAAAWLDEAQLLLNSAPAGAQKAYKLLELARSYIQIDAETAFKNTGRAIDTINGLSRQTVGDETQWQFLRNNPSDPLSVFGSDTRLFESLARIDYDRTLTLAGRFNDPALVIASQLSVVRTNLPPVRSQP